MRTIVFFLEEPSAREMLKGLLPRVLPSDVVPYFVVFEGKQDLEKQLQRKLRGWQVPNSMIVVLRDQDAGDCEKIKSKLAATCQKAGRPESLVRIACRELESWYLGDLAAVERALGLKNLSRFQSRRRFIEPDKIVHPFDELGQLTKQAYQKVAGSRAIGPELSLTENRSHSFVVLLNGIRRLISRAEPGASPN